MKVALIATVIIIQEVKDEQFQVPSAPLESKLQLLQEASWVELNQLLTESIPCEKIEVQVIAIPLGDQ